jgi:hypothetical protein
MLKGWLKRQIPIIKSTAQNLGIDMAVGALDSIYEVGRDILLNKNPVEAVYNQGKKEFNRFKNKFTNNLETRMKAVRMLNILERL